MRIERLDQNTKKNLLEDLLKRSPNSYGKYEESVREILDAVKDRGDEALFEYTKKFDGAEISASNILVTEEEIREAYDKVDPGLIDVIRKALVNIRSYHEKQMQYSWFDSRPDGTILGQKVTALAKVGVYVPGGKAAYPSSVLMNIMPAKVAGVDEIIMVTPPGKDGKVTPTTLVAAKEAGADKVYKAGGAQAVAALAYGTESIPHVDKIFGPGNRYVTKAKQLVGANDVAVDLPAGPSEVLVLADDGASPAFAAADLLSQAEHGGDSQAVLVCASMEFALATQRAVAEQLRERRRGEIIRESLQQSRIIVLAERADRIAFSNAYAPEHLILSMEDPWAAAAEITDAGSVFIGPWSPESAGDYASGTNHTLPTGGWARAYSGVNTDSFLRKITFQELTRAGLEGLAPTIETMAEAEGLDAHAAAVRIRLHASSAPAPSDE